MAADMVKWLLMSREECINNQAIGLLETLVGH